MADAVGLAAELDEPPVVDDAVDHGGGHPVVPEHRPPPAELQVRGDYHRLPLVCVREDLEEQPRPVRVEREKPGLAAAGEAREALLAECRAAVAAGPLSAEVEALQSIKGCGSAPAAAFASEVGDFSRFRSGRQVTAYLGPAPKRRSSADSVRLGGISGAGNALVRRLAVEGPRRYARAGHQPKLMPEGSGAPLEVGMRGGKGPERLLRRREEMLARGMPQAKANAAAELVRRLWALGAMCREATE